jgi:hypothetical protein
MHATLDADEALEHLRLIYGPAVTPGWFDDLLEDGWTRDTITVVERLAILGCDGRTPCCDAGRRIGTHPLGAPWAPWFAALTDFAGYLHQRTDQPVADLTPWLAVVAGASHHGEVTRLRRAFSRTPAGIRARTPEDRLFTRWQQAAPAPWAALAWMAGLGWSETTRLYAAGDLQARALAGLALVRGFHVDMDLIEHAVTTPDLPAGAPQ